MTLDEFQSSPDPAKFPLPLQALWHDGRGHWREAHALAQRAGSPDGDWVHAYLHRKEDDLDNAGYWYARAGHVMPDGPLDVEWAAIAGDLLAR